jgi:hypothetical protein
MYILSFVEPRALVISKLMFLIRDVVHYKSGSLLGGNYQNFAVLISTDKASVWDILQTVLGANTLITTNYSATLVQATLVVITSLLESDNATAYLPSLIAKLFSHDVNQLHPIPVLLFFQRLASANLCTPQVVDYFVRYNYLVFLNRIRFQNGLVSRFPLTVLAFIHSIYPLLPNNVQCGAQYEQFLYLTLKDSQTIDSLEGTHIATLWMTIYCMHYVKLTVSSTEGLQHLLSSIEASSKWKLKDKDGL